MTNRNSSWPSLLHFLLGVFSCFVVCGCAQDEPSGKDEWTYQGGTGGISGGGAGGGPQAGFAGSVVGGSGGAVPIGGASGSAPTGGSSGTKSASGTGGETAIMDGGSVDGGQSFDAASGAGGASGTGGASDAGGAGQGGSLLADAYPCPGDPASYNAVATKTGETWTVTNSGSTVSSANNMQAAIEAALGSLNSGRSAKESVLVQGSGDISGSAQLRVAGNTILNVCGTINVTNDVSGSDRAPIYARGTSDIDIPNVTITGHAQYGMFFRDVSNLHLGKIVINGTGGLGIRIDSHGSRNRNNASNITLDYVQVENTGGHGVEFYGVDGIEIGTVVARSTANCGLILNDSINADIGLVDAVDAAYIDTGYAAFRTANTNGRYDDGSYPTNIFLRELRATGGGRGFFCVSASGGVQIDNFVIDHVGGSPAIFIENCYNVTLASQSGSGQLMSGHAHIGHNSRNGDPSRDVTFQNITLSDGAYIDQNSATCGRNNTAINVTGGDVDLCG